MHLHTPSFSSNLPGGGFLPSQTCNANTLLSTQLRPNSVSCSVSCSSISLRQHSRPHQASFPNPERQATWAALPPPTQTSPTDRVRPSRDADRRHTTRQPKACHPSIYPHAHTARATHPQIRPPSNNRQRSRSEEPIQRRPSYHSNAYRGKESNAWSATNKLKREVLHHPTSPIPVRRSKLSIRAGIGGRLRLAVERTYGPDVLEPHLIDGVVDARRSGLADGGQEEMTIMLGAVDSWVLTFSPPRTGRCAACQVSREFGAVSVGQ